MTKSRLFCVALLCLLLGMTSAMAGNIAIDEDFDGGGLFVDRGGTEPTTVVTTVQGVNIYINPSSQNANYSNAGTPVNYVDDPAAGGIAAIDATHNCYQLNPTKTLQFGTMIGTTATWVNGNIPVWGDGNVVVQAALATNNSAALLADGVVVGKLEIAYHGLAITNVANLRKVTYELRVDDANNEVDVWAIKNGGAQVKVLDGLNGTNWANISTVIFCRGLNTDANASKWAAIIGGQKGPAAQTVMATNASGDSARLSVFVNSDTPATTDGYDASNADGRLALDGRNDARIMGIKFTAGATTPLFIDNFFCASEGFTYVATPDTATTNKHGRLNPFTALVQGVPSGGPAPTPTPTPAPGAGVDTWEIYY